MDVRAPKGEDSDIGKVIAAASQIAQRKGSKLAAKSDFVRFITQFYRGSSPDELAARSPDALYNIALTAWDCFETRSPGKEKISIMEGEGDRSVVLIVNDDMPFLVDSVNAELERMDHSAMLLVHPILSLKRDANGRVESLGDTETDASGALESLMYIEIPKVDFDMAERLKDNLHSVLSDVRLSVNDWQAMRREAAHFAADFDSARPGVTQEQSEEVADFLKWLHDDHFTFLGYRRFTFEGKGKNRILKIENAHSLGLLKKTQRMIFEGIADGAPLPPQFADFVDSPSALFVVKANQRSTVHRRVHFDVVAVKIFDAKGNVAGMHMFVGLFTADVYTNSPNFVPVLRRKIDRIRDRMGFRKHGHDGKALQNIMENLPRDELFESSDDYLLNTALGILHLQQRPRPTLFMRLDRFERFASILVFVPRDRFDTALRVTIGDILTRELDGRLSSFYTQVTDSPLARIHYIIATKPGRVPKVKTADLEERIAKAARAWSDELRAALIKTKGETEGTKLAEVFAHGFPASYRERFDTMVALHDIERICSCAEEKQVKIHVYQPPGATGGTVHIKIYNPATPIPLSDVMPVLENMGFKVIGEEPFHITPRGASTTGGVWLHDFDMTISAKAPFALADVREEIEDSFCRVWAGEMESDGFNKLVALSDLAWREVTILRAYAKYLRQAAFPFSQAYIENAFAAHPKLARLLVDLFLTTFDPALNSGAKAKATATTIEGTRKEIGAALDGITNADEDRILRRYLNLIDCTLRTNFFQPFADGKPKWYISMKLDSQRIEELPLPRMNVEVFVYAPRVEAIHLRGGKVARGGIRWSDRREDFRSEVLGLVKAQMVKNAVIVPTGSKGGFVVKQPPATGGRDAFLAEGIECYKTLQRGLLDITDNVVNDKIVHPDKVVRRDADDPYLVVAADKGTATFSDIANGVSAEYGFWLGDAYASGGSAGYDHKVMGITARGAWECVKRHFREIGVDTQTQDFTCVGVGDMSGDVFGNGMLMSEHIKLQAAFNHLHIFIDPDPNPAKGFKERERLFKMPRSNWTDYDAKLISKGGGVFERSAKTIKLSAEMKTLLEINKAEATPTEIINAILRAKVDLMFFGGIGTYVKASDESNADASDRANDAHRINGHQIRAKVVGEGANLGMTQRGRIEAAKEGVRLNTDAIDNSAGVDCSDHEVNIKILLNGEMRKGKITLEARNKLLAEMTDEVAHLVLRDNYQQSQTISMMQHRAPALLDTQQRTMKLFERDGLLNRDIEFLPNDEEFQERLTAGRGLVRPELAVFLSYGKMWLYDKIVTSDLVDDPIVEEDLHQYFPAPLQKKFSGSIEKHKLRREIIGTVITNSFINRVGPSFINALMERTGMGPVDIARAYTVTRAAYGLRDLWTAIEALDNKVPAEIQLTMLWEVERMVVRSVLWMLRHCPIPMDMAATIKSLKPAVDTLRKSLKDLWSEEVARYVQRQANAYTAKGVPAELAHSVASLYRLAAANDVNAVTNATKQPLAAVAKMYFLVGQRFGLGGLRERTETFGTQSHWDRLAVSAAIEELFAHQTTITTRVLASAKGGKVTGAKALDAWVDANKTRVDRFDQVLAEIKAADNISLSMLTVANRQLSAMTAG
ncbi:MAG: NAD-glutamate dehydrogenase [Proteobacteria bacterium]|nr:NAD-glutamate dehydrogenase [Pseudomonadota bacterium]